MEFRCFVKNRKFIAVSQRDPPNKYTFLQSAQERGRLWAILHQFMAGFVVDRFQLDSFVCDVYVTSKPRVRIVDFAPFGPPTDSLLFSWSELEEIESHDASDGRENLRVCGDEVSEILPSRNLYCGLPDELSTLQGRTEGDKETAIEILLKHAQLGS